MSWGQVGGLTYSDGGRRRREEDHADLLQHVFLPSGAGYAYKICSPLVIFIIVIFTDLVFWHQLHSWLCSHCFNLRTELFCHILFHIHFRPEFLLRHLPTNLCIQKNLLRKATIIQTSLRKFFDDRKLIKVPSPTSREIQRRSLLRYFDGRKLLTDVVVSFAAELDTKRDLPGKYLSDDGGE